MSEPVPGNISKDIASGIAITICIFTISNFLPLLGFFCAIFIPLPILFYRSKLGRKSGGIVPIVTAVIMLVIAGRISIDIVFYLEMLLLGFVLSEMIELNLSVEKTILYTCSIVLLSCLAALLFYSMISNTGIKALVSNYISRNLELTLALYKDMGVSEKNILLISNSLGQIHYALVRLIPALVITSLLFVAWTNMLLARPLLTRNQIFFPSFGPLNLWRPPEQLVWGVIVCGGILLLPVRELKMLGLNGLLILLTVYFFGGVAIVSYFFESKKTPPLVRFFLYSLIALQQFLLLAVIGVGFFDTWLNFRKINTTNDVTE